MRLITLKDREITSYEHSQMKKHALEQAIAEVEEKRNAEQRIANQNQIFDQLEQYKNELFFLIQSPERIQMLDDSFKHDVNFICQAVEFNPLVIDYLDEFMLNNKEIFLNLLAKKENAYLIAKIGDALSYDASFLSEAIKINPNCKTYLNPTLVTILNIPHNTSHLKNITKSEELNHYVY